MTFHATSEDAGKRLDRLLQERFPECSRTRIQAWVKEGQARVNGRPAKASWSVRAGDVIEVEPREAPPLAAFPEQIPLEVLHQDEDVVAVNKPAGMVVHLGAGRHSGTLVNALLHRFSRLSGLGGELRPGIVHRLDGDTSGVLLVALTDAAHRNLAAQFASRAVSKVYLALVHGVVKEERGRIDKPIARDPWRRNRMSCKLERGRAAVTEYLVLRRFREFTLLEVRIHTGRTHQIRVHLASLGHPVAGDRLYGAPASAAGRFFLHARQIGFLSPSTGLPVTVQAPLPPELERWLEGLL